MDDANEAKTASTHLSLPPRPPLRQSGPSAGMQASKYLRLQALMDAEEMTSLIEALGEVYFYHTNGLMTLGEEGISKEEFLKAYSYYAASLEAGVLPDEQLYRSLFYATWTADPSALFVVPCPGERQLVKAALPVVQLQKHNLAYSSVDGQFRPMVLGTNSISWGIQFSYPQLFQDSPAGDIVSVTDGQEFPNTALFRTLQRWLRHNTLPTPFTVDGQRTNVPMRLGKRCFEWIHRHPQLATQGIVVSPCMA